MWQVQMNKKIQNLLIVFLYGTSLPVLFVFYEELSVSFPPNSTAQQATTVASLLVLVVSFFAVSSYAGRFNGMGVEVTGSEIGDQPGPIAFVATLLSGYFIVGSPLSQFVAQFLDWF